MHAHHYLQFGFSSITAFELHSPNWSKPQRVQSFVIPSDVSHQIRLKGKVPVLIIWLDPEFNTLNSFSSSQEIQTSLQELERELEPLYEQPLECKLAHEIRNIITGSNEAGKLQELDDRITNAIQWIKSHLCEQTITIETLAKEVFLSPSRFMHLFSEEIGIPARKYILWQRLRYALLLLADGSSITEASIEAGFTDSSHMNRNFNAMFGITPSKIFKNSRFIQVIGC